MKNLFIVKSSDCFRISSCRFSFLFGCCV